VGAGYHCGAHSTESAPPTPLSWQYRDFSFVVLREISTDISGLAHHEPIKAHVVFLSEIDELAASAPPPICDMCSL
jgi:hypothetical protein